MVTSAPSTVASRPLNLTQRYIWWLLAAAILISMVLVFQIRLQEHDALRGKTADQVLHNTLELHPKVQNHMNPLINCMKRGAFTVTRDLEIDDFWRPRTACPLYGAAIEAQANSPMTMREVQVAYSYLIHNLQKGL